MYRREGWDVLLSGVLPNLQQCALKLRQRQKYVEYCFAIATWPIEEAPGVRTAAFSAASAVVQETSQEEATNWNG